MLRSILFLNSLVILIINVLNSIKVWKKDYLFHYFFKDFSLALQLSVAPSDFLFYLTFSVSKNLGETVIYCDLEELFLCESVP